MKIGILTYDNGEYDVYCGFFANPDKLMTAVEKLNKERRDDNGEEANANVMVINLVELPDGPITNEILDQLAGMCSDSGVEIERTEEFEERIREQEAEARGEESLGPIVVAPGQIGMDG